MRLRLLQLGAGAVLIGSLSLPWWRRPSGIPRHDAVVGTGWHVLDGADHLIAVAVVALLLGAWLPWARTVRFAAVLATVAWVLAADVVRYAVTGPECRANDVTYTPLAGLFLAIVAALALAAAFLVALRAAIRAAPATDARDRRTPKRGHVATVLPATLVVVVSLALPWYALPYDSADATETAWSVFAGADTLIALVAVVLALAALLPEARRPAAAAGLATLAGLLVVDVARYVPFDPDCFGTTMVPQAGLYLALAGATVTFAAYLVLALRG